MVLITRNGLKRPIEGPGFVLLKHIPSARDFRHTRRPVAPPKPPVPKAPSVR